MTDYLIKDAPGKGKGLFSEENIPANHTILKFVGKPLLRQNIPDFSGAIASCYLQIGPETYLDLVGHPSYFINHSCNPNCRVQVSLNAAFLVSLREIKKGEEFEFDYSTTSTEDNSTWSMPCNCSQFYCRKDISGFHSLEEVHKNKYTANNTLPYYIKK